MVRNWFAGIAMLPAAWKLSSLGWLGLETPLAIHRRKRSDETGLQIIPDPGKSLGFQGRVHNTLQ